MYNVLVVFCFVFDCIYNKERSQVNFIGVVSKLPKIVKRISLVIIDIVAIILAYMFTYLFIPQEYGIASSAFFSTVLLAIIIYIIFWNVFRIYRNITIYSSIQEYIVLACTCAISAWLITMIETILPIATLSMQTNILAGIFIAVETVAVRGGFRCLVNYINSKGKKEKKNILIIGAGQATSQIIRNITVNMGDEYNIVGIIDDDTEKRRCLMYGVEVIGNRLDIKRICEKENVNLILFSIQNIKEKEKNEVLNICNDTNAKVKVMLPIEKIIHGKDIDDSFRDVELEDLLGRESIKLNNNEISDFLKGKIVLVTGAGGSIGSELCRQIATFSPEKLIMLDIYENSLYEVERELQPVYGEDIIKTVIASIRDKKRLNEIFKEYRPQIVFHAAAHKHVPLMENSPMEAIKNNVFGTYNVVACSNEYGVDRFVLISTDKAVNPTSIMGATKRICEMIVQAKNSNSKTNYVAVRFGNVLGSNGSVIPLFKKQIQEGGPVTVTHKEITRYFMLIPEAVGLILQAGTYAKGGEIFVLDMGEPVKIYDLAKTLIKFSGKNIPIKITGLRKGEKLYEELLIAEEGLTKTANDKIMISKIEQHDEKEINEKLQKLIENDNCTRHDVRQMMKEIVPTFIDKNIL